MNISKENNELILRIPLWQEDFDAANERIADKPNLIGIIAKDEYSISHLIALGYKDDVQEGGPIIMFGTKEELEQACKILELDIWEHPLCAYCGNAIRGSFTYGEKGNQCYQCEQ